MNSYGASNFKGFLLDLFRKQIKTDMRAFIKVYRPRGATE